jgi:hypothetical protein
MQTERELNCSNLAIRRREKRTGRRRCSGSTVMTMVAGELLASPDLTLVWSWSAIASHVVMFELLLPSPATCFPRSNARCSMFATLGGCRADPEGLGREEWLAWGVVLALPWGPPRRVIWETLHPRRRLAVMPPFSAPAASASKNKYSSRAAAPPSFANPSKQYRQKQNQIWHNLESEERRGERMLCSPSGWG